MKKFALAPLAAILAIVLAACSATGGTDPAPALELSAGGGDEMMSCLAFDPARLAETSVGFDGTATAVDGDQVTLDVDRWFKGGESDEVVLVVLVVPQGLEALIGGIPFGVGGAVLDLGDRRQRHKSPHGLL